MSGPEAILVERNGAVATVTLNAPPKNPIGNATVERLKVLLPELDGEVVFRGAGKEGFSAGANIKEFGTGIGGLGLDGWVNERTRVLDAVENLSKPAIAEIYGACLGGGLELAMSCHFRLAAEDALLGLPEIELGAVPCWGGTQRLVSLVGRARALDLLLRGRKVSGAEAARLGLVNEAHPQWELAGRVRELAEELAGKAPLSVAGILKAVLRPGRDGLEQGYRLELDAVRRTSGSRDNLEGIQAFLQKRKPVFKGD